MEHGDNRARTLDPGLIHDVFVQFPEVMAVYLFGSTASGKNDARSDLDLAVIPREKGLKIDKLKILTELARIGLCRVDLVVLDTTDVVLKYEAVCQNQVIYQTDEFDRGATYSRIVREYLDFLPYLERQRKAYKQRLLHG